MPYITKTRRKVIDEGGDPLNAGELNYAFTSLIVRYIKATGELNYQKINDVLGALSGAAREFYRRVAMPYENRKISDNGDVYEEILPKSRPYVCD